MKKYLPFVGLMMLCVGLTSQNAWINELHYDDVGSDTNEVVEIVIENAGNYSLSSFELFLYNGNGGSTYDNESADQFIAGEVIENFSIFYWEPSSMQNGAPDGLALAYDGVLIEGQFLSYEGEFTATNGPASGTGSVDIGVSESGAPEGFALQLSGTGMQYSDFSWQPPDTSSTGEINHEQLFISNANSSESDIVKAAGWSEPVNIDYTLYFESSGLDSGNAIEMAKFELRDGGAPAADDDELATTLASVTLKISHFENLQALAIFNGSENIAEATVNDSLMAFNELTGLFAPDDGSREFSVYATFKSLVNDNENLGFLIFEAVADPSGSGFAHPDAGGAQTDDSGDNNRLIVVADRLLINSPGNVTISTDFPLELEATDANGSRDLDEDSPVSLELIYGPGALSSAAGLDQTLSAGHYNWDDIQYDQTGEFMIEAQSTELLNGLSDTISASEAKDTGLFLSLLCDPQNEYATDRFIQIYNSHDQSIDMTGWKLVAVGNNADIFYWELSGTIKPGEAKTCGDDEHTRFMPDFAEAEWSSSNSTWNGGSGDGARLVHDTVVIDDASLHGDFSNSAAIRNPEIIAPSADFDLSEWTSAPVDYADEEPSTYNLHLCEAPQIPIVSSGTWSEVTDGFGHGASFIIGGSVTVEEEASSPAMCYNLEMLTDAHLQIGPGKALTVNGELIMEMNGRANPILSIVGDSAGNGSLIIKNQSDNPVINFQRFINGYAGDADGWHLISSPVSDMEVSGSDFEPGAQDDLYQWDESSNVWDNYKNNGWNQTQFISGLGYLAAYENADTKTFTGKPVYSDITFTNLSFSSGSGEGWHLLGNPFPSALLWVPDKWALDNVESAAHIWNDQAGNYTLISAGGILPSTNGFFVKVSDPSNQLIIPASERIHDLTNNYKNDSREFPSRTLDILVTCSGNEYLDRCRIGFHAAASDGYDVKFDVHKLLGKETAPRLWTVIEGENFARNIFSGFMDARQVMVCFQAGISAGHKLNMNGLDTFDEFHSIYLEDLFTGEMIDLKLHPEYIFEASTDDDHERFRIHFSDVTLDKDHDAPDNIRLFGSDGSIQIRYHQTFADSVNLKIYNLAGQLIFSSGKNRRSTYTIQPDLQPGIYIVQFLVGRHIYHKKLFIR